jgi:hypothetical protein
LATDRASVSASSKRSRAVSDGKPAPSPKRKKQTHHSPPPSTPFSKIVDAMEGNIQKVGKGPWADRLLHPCVIQSTPCLEGFFSRIL